MKRARDHLNDLKHIHDAIKATTAAHARLPKPVMADIRQQLEDFSNQASAGLIPCEHDAGAAVVAARLNVTESNARSSLAIQKAATAEALGF